MRMNTSAHAVLRWLAVPLSALLGLVGSAVVLEFVVGPFAYSTGWLAGRPEIATGVQGTLVAGSMLTAAWATAPSNRRLILVLTYATGAWMAWWLLRTWHFPEQHPRAYEHSDVPLVMTLAGGLLWAAFLWARSTRRSRTVPVR